jgi:hypothetical protein
MVSYLRKLSLVVACGIAAALSAASAAAQGSPLRMVQSPQGFCNPCRPAPTITGAHAGAEVLLVRERYTGEGWQAVFAGVIGRADKEGRLTVPVPAERGVYRAYVVMDKRNSNPVYFEVIDECAPPIYCDPEPTPTPTPFRVTLGAFELRPREPQTIVVEQARPRAWLILVRQRFNGAEWETVLERELGVADPEGRLLDVEPTDQLGLFRDIIRDGETGSSSDASIYEVRLGGK